LIFLATLPAANDQVYKFNSFDKQNGLPSNTITSIKQGKKGYLWIGIKNRGLFNLALQKKNNQKSEKYSLTYRFC